jgi:hypothetical protein
MNRLALIRDTLGKHLAELSLADGVIRSVLNAVDNDRVLPKIAESPTTDLEVAQYNGDLQVRIGVRQLEFSPTGQLEVATTLCSDIEKALYGLWGL